MDQIKVNRIRNILYGDYTSDTTIHTGYESSDHHREGEIWEEGGKSWTIKNGIKCSITKYSAIRKEVSLPLFCPSCNTIMNHHLDEKFWKIRGKCFDCVIKEDTKLMAEGAFEDYSDIKIKENILTYLGQTEAEILDYINNLDVKQYITENGDIEEWISEGMTSEQVKEKLLSDYHKMKEELLEATKKE